MEDLSKQQIILVTLLVSFVTSIATGIITVSYMDQAPQTFTQTVNKVVERTIERVVPDASLIKAVEPKIITLDDQVATVAEMGQQAVAKIYGDDDALVAMGAVISKDGKVVTSVPAGKYKIVYADGTTASTQNINATGTMTLIPNETKTLKYAPLYMGTAIKPGKTIVLVGGKEGNEVFSGIIQANATSTGLLLSTPNQTLNGAFFLDLTGDVLGININGTYAPIK